MGFSPVAKKGALHFRSPACAQGAHHQRGWGGPERLLKVGSVERWSAEQHPPHTAHACELFDETSWKEDALKPIAAIASCSSNSNEVDPVHQANGASMKSDMWIIVINFLAHWPLTDAQVRNIWIWNSMLRYYYKSLFLLLESRASETGPIAIKTTWNHLILILGLLHHHNAPSIHILRSDEQPQVHYWHRKCIFWSLVPNLWGGSDTGIVSGTSLIWFFCIYFKTRSVPGGSLIDLQISW